MIVDHLKDSAKGSFKGALIVAIGAGIVYMVIKFYEGIK